MNNSCPAGQLRQYVNANRIGLEPPTRDDDLVQQMMAMMRECARERGTRYEIPWLNVMYGVCVMEECGEFVYHAYVLQGGGGGDETVETGMKLTRSL